MTVRMVPSTGVPTAAYAPSVASRSARAMMLALRSSAVAPAMVVATAPSIWLRITPLLPRAPSRAPRAQARPGRPGGRRRRRRLDGLAERVAGRGHGEVHVGAGVAVGHRVDVEGVDLLAGLRERVDRDVDEAEHHRQLDRAAAAGHLLHLANVSRPVLVRT